MGRLCGRVAAALVNVLIHKSDHLGDFVLALPSLWEVRQMLGEQADLHLLVRGSNTEWQSIIPWLGTLHAVTHPRYERSKPVSKIKLSLAALKIASDLRHCDFDWGIDLVSTRNDLLGKWLLWCAGCRQTSGPDGAHSWMLSRRQAEPDAHQTQILASRYPSEWKISGTSSPSEFMPAEFRWSREVHVQRAMVLAPFAGTAAKKWPGHCWKELFQELELHGPVQILVPQPELQRHHHFLSQFPDQSLQVVKTIKETLQVLVNARACVTLDTAVAHYAWLTGTPYVQLFARTAEPARWAPVSGGVTLESHPDLPPSVSEQILPGYEMDDISVKQVIETWHGLEGRR